MSVKLKAVKSANIRGVGFDRDAGVLIVEFKSGARWNYDGVPEQAFEEMTAGTVSVGSYFARHIRGRYPESRVIRKRVRK